MFVRVCGVCVRVRVRVYLAIAAAVGGGCHLIHRHVSTHPQAAAEFCLCCSYIHVWCVCVSVSIFTPKFHL